jgi:chromosome segregation ATPase
MIFALGFLAASLLALLVIPALNARAERLARRRAEALFPLSVSELTAEKDHLRAEFAVLQRRIERKAEEAQAVKHQSMEELGRRAIRIDALESQLAERDAVIAQLEGNLAEVRSRFAAADDELTGARVQLTGSRDTLEAIEEAHRRTLDELASSRAELDRTATALAAAKTDLALALDRLEARESEFADLDGRHGNLLSELDAKRITISDLETRLAMQKARGDDFERALGERRGELSEERERLAELARNLLAEQERGLMLDGQIRDLEVERDERAREAAALAARLAAIEGGDAGRAAADERAAAARLERELEQARVRIASLETAGGGATPERGTLAGELAAARAEIKALEGTLGAVRQERTRLDQEVQALRRAGPVQDEIRAENGELRRLVMEVADQVLQAADGAAAAPKGRRKARG